MGEKTKLILMVGIMTAGLFCMWYCAEWTIGTIKDRMNDRQELQEVGKIGGKGKRLKEDQIQAKVDEYNSEINGMVAIGICLQLLCVFGIISVWKKWSAMITIFAILIMPLAVYFIWIIEAAFYIKVECIIIFLVSVSTILCYAGEVQSPKEESAA
jgi:hypothetical protein